MLFSDNKDIASLHCADEPEEKLLLNVALGGTAELALGIWNRLQDCAKVRGIHFSSVYIALVEIHLIDLVFHTI